MVSKSLLFFALLAAVAATPAGSSTTREVGCRGGALRGTFAAVPGSAGAGNIVYELRLKNVSSSTCFVSGIPGLRLLTRSGGALPTHAVPANRGALTAVKVTLKPGASASTSARFSPDVPGPGEGHPGPCEPVAYKLRVTPSAGGSAVVPVRPATSVCEHGTMTLPALTAAH
jgi:hypothetical protein